MTCCHCRRERQARTVWLELGLELAKEFEIEFQTPTTEPLTENPKDTCLSEDAKDAVAQVLIMLSAFNVRFAVSRLSCFLLQALSSHQLSFLSFKRSSASCRVIHLVADSRLLHSLPNSKNLDSPSRRAL